MTPAPERNPLFPGLWGALWLVLASFLGEYATGALVADLLPLSEPMHRAALTRLLANALLFTGLMSFKGLGYRALFHSGPSSVQATLALTLLPVVALVPGLLLAIGWVAEQLAQVFPLSRWEEQAFSSMSEGSLASVLMTCVLAPVLEEMLFRGVILRSFLRRYAPPVAIVHSAAIFGLAHLNLYQFVVALILGLLLGWLYERTRSLWPCIALHAAYNTGVTLFDTEPAALMGVAAVASGLLALAWLARCLGWPGQSTQKGP